MRKLTYLLLAVLFYSTIAASEPMPWSSLYQNFLMEQVGLKVRELSSYSSIEYPSQNIQPILEKFPEGKLLLFGYGSLMNASSAARSMSPDAIHSMRPVVAFGFKRIFIR